VPGVRTAPTPRAILYRIGHLPNPVALPPRDETGRGRFDDPRREFRTLYAAARRQTAFLETLAPHRSALAAIVGLQPVELRPTAALFGRVRPSWRAARAVGRLRLRPRQRWLDLRALTTREALRHELAPRLLERGNLELDLSGVVGPHRALTQTIARWAYDRGFAGLVYHSRFHAPLTCWAIFEGAGFDVVGHPEPIAADDPASWR
jgi:hypothetical protein